MKLLTKEIEKALEAHPIGSQDGKGMDAEVVVKFFHPMGGATWLVTEGEREGNDWRLFGYATLGHEWEWGYMMLSELQSVKVRGLGVERDMYVSKGSKVGDLVR